MDIRNRKTVEAPATFTVRPLSAEEAKQTFGGAAYIKFDGIDGDVARVGTLIPVKIKHNV